MIVGLEDLYKVRRNTSKTIVLATGTFDLFHYEHVMYLQDAKGFGDILVVAVKGNNGAWLKGVDRPVIDEKHRISIVDAIKYVDYSVIVDYNSSIQPTIPFDNEEQRQWLVMFEQLFNVLKPDILYYENNPVLQTARDKAFQEYEIQGISKERGESISTSVIVEKLAKLS